MGPGPQVDLNQVLVGGSLQGPGGPHPGPLVQGSPIQSGHSGHLPCRCLFTSWLKSSGSASHTPEFHVPLRRQNRLADKLPTLLLSHILQEGAQRP